MSENKIDFFKSTVEVVANKVKELGGIRKKAQSNSDEITTFIQSVLAAGYWQERYTHTNNQ